jgi:hypothetical protein
MTGLQWMVLAAALLKRSVPAERIAGTRYAEYAMAHLDSER